jgi:hypothetical protein
LAIFRPGRCHNLDLEPRKVLFGEIISESMVWREIKTVVALHSVKITLLKVDIFKVCYHTTF